MATKVSTTLVDDTDPSLEASQTVTFSIDGTSYEIDLTDDHAEALREALTPWKDAARVTSRPASNHHRRRTNSNYDPAKVRDWATQQGIELSKRGRISADVIAAYRASGH